MPDNRAELVIVLRDELTAALDNVVAKVGAARGQFSGLGGAAQQASAGLAGVGESGTGAWAALSMAGGHVTALVGQLAALVGVSLSVAGAFAAVKKGLEEINQFNLKEISTAAMMLSRANIENQQDAYRQYKAYVLSMYEALEAETVRHFASGNEMIDSFSAFAKKGIYAAQEEAGAIGVITDAVKLLHGGYVDQATMLHEIQGVLEGHAGMHFKLAQTLKGIIGPEWKEIVQSHIQDGTLLTFLEDKFKGLAVAGGDIQGTLTSQASTLSTLLAQVGRGGLGGAYQDIVGLIVDLNGYLRTNKDDIMMGVATGWQQVHDLVVTVKDDIGWINEHSSVKVPTAPAERTTGQQLTVDINTLMQPMTYINALLETANYLWQGIIESPGKAVDNYTSLANETQLLLDKVGEVAHIVENSAFMHWAVDTEGFKKNVDYLEGKVGWLVDIFSKVYTWTINIKMPGLPSWLGGSAGAPATSAPSGISTTRGGAYVPYKPMPDYPGQLAIMQGNASVKVVAGPTGDYIGQTFPTGPPPWSPAKPDAGKGGGGKGGSEDAEARRLMSLYDTLNKDISKLSGGSWDEIGANLDKTLDQIYSRQETRATTEAELEVMARKRASLQKQKLEDDFWLYVAKESGDAYVQIDAEYNRDLQKYQGISGAKEQLDWIRENKRYETYQKCQKEIEDLQGSALKTMAQSTPFLGEQLGLESRLLEVEINRAHIELNLHLQKLLNAHQISAAQADEIRGAQAVADQYRRFAQEQKAWSTQGFSGGVKLFALDLQKESETAVAFGVRDGLKRAQGAADSAITDMLMFKKKLDFKKIGLDMAGQFVQGWVHIGTTNLFGFFSIGVQNMVATWAAGQTAMTAASQAGEAARMATSSGGAEASMGIMTALAKGKILVQAGRAAASAFTWVMEEVPWPLNAILAPAAAAVAFAATAAFGDFGSSPSGLSGAGEGTGGGPGEYSQGAYHGGGIVAHTGMILSAHDGLAPEEVMVKALRKEWILNPDAASSLAATGGPETFAHLNAGRLPVLPLPVALPAPPPPGSFTTPGRQARPESAPAGDSFHHTTLITIVSETGQVLERRTERRTFDRTVKKMSRSQITIRGKR